MFKLFSVMATLIYLTYTVAGQSLQSARSEAPARSLESKLAQKATFIPEGMSALDQLIAIAKHYQIPMGVEWLEQPPGAEQPPAPAPGAGATVRELIDVILRQAPGYQATVNEGVLHINQPGLAAATQNPLNLRIAEFTVKDRNLFDAQAGLRLRIDMALHPEEYEEGYIGDYGYPPIESFMVRNITFSGSNLTVREILDKIAVANGNAMWIVRFDKAQVKAGSFPSQKRRTIGLSRVRKPRSPKPRPQEGQTGIDFHWNFVPLREAIGNK